MKTIRHTKTFEMPLPIAELFPLFSPEGEKYWPCQNPERLSSLASMRSPMMRLSPSGNNCS